MAGGGVKNFGRAGQIIHQFRGGVCTGNTLHVCVSHMNDVAMPSDELVD